MKKKLGILAVIVILIGAAAFYKWNSDQIICQLHKNLTHTDMMAQSGGFTIVEKSEVEIRVKTNVSEGEVTITLQDEKGNIVHTFNTNCTEKEKLTLDAGSYEMRMDSEGCKGKFDVTVRK